MQFYTFFSKFLIMWLMSVVFESVSSVTHDVHRIVLTTTTHHQRDKDRQHEHRNHNKHYSNHANLRKPVAHESHEDEFSSGSSTKSHYHYYNNNYRSNIKSGNHNGYKRGKARYHDSSTIKSLNIADIIELTTSYPEKVPVPIIDSYFQNYYQPAFPILNNSIDLFIPNDVRNNENTINITFSGKTRQLREKEINSLKNFTRGYEVYEEIIGDISPPPLPDLRHNNNIQSLPVLNTPIPLSISSTTITIKNERNRIKQNVSDIPSENETTTRLYGKRTKSRRNRGDSKF